MLQAGFAASDELAEELRQYVRKRPPGHAYPREIEFVDDCRRRRAASSSGFILRNAERAARGTH